MASKVVSDNFETGSGAVPELGGADRQSQWCKAWVNFNGTGTVAIRDSFNVSSITDLGTGDYRIHFTNSMSNADYIAHITNTNWNTHGYAGTTSSTTSYTRAYVANYAYTEIDVDYVGVSVFSN